MDDELRDNDLDYAAIRRRVEIELQQDRRRGQTALFAVNVLLFCFFMLLVWVILPNTISSITMTSADYFSSITAVYNTWSAKVLLSIGWIIGLLLHGLAVYRIGSKGWTDRYRRRLLAREIEYARLGIDEDLLDEATLVEKTKGGRKSRLSDEDEMPELTDQQNDTTKREERHA